MPIDTYQRRWIKLWVKECLLGTIREDLIPEERGVWYDFLLLAGNSRIPGVICANATTPLSITRIGQILNTPEKLIERCIQKFTASERIAVKDGMISIANWEQYQFSDYDRQKPYRQRSRREDEYIPGTNVKSDDPDKFIKGKYGHMVKG